jgi:hypothetical protein
MVLVRRIYQLEGPEGLPLLDGLLELQLLGPLREDGLELL